MTDPKAIDMTQPATIRRATDQEIATAKAWVEHISADWEQAPDTERERQQAYEYALEVLVFADGGRHSEPPPADLTKLTVNLTPRAIEALNTTADRLGDTRTDTVNRALQLYALVTGMAESEVVTLMVRDGEPMTLVRVGDDPGALASASKSIEAALKLLRGASRKAGD